MSEGTQIEPRLDYEPFSGVLLLAPLKVLSTLRCWAFLPLFIGAAVAVAACEGMLLGPGIPPLAPFQHQLGLPIASSYPAIPLERDVCNLLLIATVPLTIVCVHRQWRYIADCVPNLEMGGALTWKESPTTMGFLDRLLITRSPAKGTDSREAMVDFLQQLGLRRRRFDLFALVFAIGVATAFAVYMKDSHAFLALAPAGPSAKQATWATHAYANWWASWQHPAGAVVYGLILVLGVYIVVAQNYVSMKSVRIMRAAQLFGSFNVNWLNADGAYGWQPFQQVFRMAYVSMALRATQLVLLIVLLSLQDLLIVVAIGTGWLIFLCLYIAYPYCYLRSQVRSLKEEQLDKLARNFDGQKLSIDVPTETSRHFVEEIGRVQEASINPMKLTRWQSSSFAVVVLLPICLTVLQIVS